MHSEHSNQNSKKIPFLQELGEIRIVSNGNREVIVENLRKILGLGCKSKNYLYLCTAKPPKSGASPDGGIGRRAGLKHQ